MSDATMNVLGHGFYYEEMPVGFKFRTKGRTITETDLVTYINLTWFTEELFVNVHGQSVRSLSGRVVPAALLFTFAEGLIHPSMEFTGQAFLGTTMKVLRPTYVGDTIRVECEVIAARVESKGRRGSSPRKTALSRTKTKRCSSTSPSDSCCCASRCCRMRRVPSETPLAASNRRNSQRLITRGDTEVPGADMTTDSIPLIDIAGLRQSEAAATKRIAQEIYDACTTVGFFYAVGHGVPQDVIDTAFAMSKSFFEQRRRFRNEDWMTFKFL